MIESLLRIIEASHGWNAALLALFSLAVYVAAANFAWSIARSSNAPLAEQLRRAGAQSSLRVLFEILRLVYYIGIPFAALYFGWIDLRVMGMNLRLFNWADGARLAIVIVLAAWLLLMAIWLPYLRATRDVYATPETQSSFPRRIVELVYMQAHWAFYRATAITFLTGAIPPTDAVYWGTALGLGLTALEAIAAPRIRQRLTQIGAADAIVWNFGQALLNALGFAATGNLYLLLLIHFLLDLTVPHLRAQVATRAAVPLPPVPRPVTLREQKTSE